MAELRGIRGELVDRLIWLCSGDSDEWAHDNLLMLGGYAGCLPSEGIGRFDLARYEGTLRSQLDMIVGMGLDEQILVRGLRDELDRWWNGRADVEAGNAAAQDMRGKLEHIRDNPVDYLGRMGETPAEVVEHAEEMLRSRLFQPIDADAAADRWSGQAMWAKQKEALLSDEILDAWRAKAGRA
ncbi:MAG TPA: hypothetical protein VHV74_01520 [Pseudonocardiaceae bacterium]|nr:hypothetical protein [Pseudonocardiaceae bacterium]